MPASVTVEGGGSGLYLDCFLDASLEQQAIAGNGLLIHKTVTTYN